MLDRMHGGADGATRQTKAVAVDDVKKVPIQVVIENDAMGVAVRNLPPLTRPTNLFCRQPRAPGIVRRPAPPASYVSPSTRTIGRICRAARSDGIVDGSAPNSTASTALEVALVSKVPGPAMFL